MTRQVTVYISNRTERLEQEIAEHRGLPGDRFRTRLYEALVSEEHNRMRQEGRMTAITNIDVVFSEDALFGDVTGEDVDRPASVAAYRASLINYIYDAYPQAEIVVTAGITDSVTVNGASDHAEIDAIKSLMDACWNGDDWLTYAEETSPRVELWEDNAGGLYDGATRDDPGEAVENCGSAQAVADAAVALPGEGDPADVVAYIEHAR